MRTEKECRDYLKVINNQLDEMVDKKSKTINVTGLNKKQKDEITNKRNCLIVQQYMVKWFLGEEE